MNAVVVPFKGRKTRQPEKAGVSPRPTPNAAHPE